MLQSGPYTFAHEFFINFISSMNICLSYPIYLGVSFIKLYYSDKLSIIAGSHQN